MPLACAISGNDTKLCGLTEVACLADHRRKYPRGHRDIYCNSLKDTQTFNETKRKTEEN